MREHFGVRRFEARSRVVGALVSVGAVVAITGVVYGLREIMPAV